MLCSASHSWILFTSSAFDKKIQHYHFGMAITDEIFAESLIQIDFRLQQPSGTFYLHPTVFLWKNKSSTKVLFTYEYTWQNFRLWIFCLVNKTILETRSKKQTQKNVFTMTSGDLVIALNNSFYWQEIPFFRA